MAATERTVPRSGWVEPKHRGRRRRTQTKITYHNSWDRTCVSCCSLLPHVLLVLHSPKAVWWIRLWPAQCNIRQNVYALVCCSVYCPVRLPAVCAPVRETCSMLCGADGVCLSRSRREQVAQFYKDNPDAPCPACKLYEERAVLKASGKPTKEWPPHLQNVGTPSENHVLLQSSCLMLVVLYADQEATSHYVQSVRCRQKVTTRKTTGLRPRRTKEEGRHLDHIASGGQEIARKRSRANWTGSRGGGAFAS